VPDVPDAPDVRAFLTAAACAAVLVSASLSPPAGGSSGGKVSVRVLDADGRPVVGAVVQVHAAGSGAAAPPAPAPGGPLVVDQRGEAFVPAISIVPVGGSVAFANSDPTAHHVFSFSAAGPFEAVVPPGARSPEIVFASAGHVSVGCNIHDHMAAHLVVAATPFAAVSGEDGVVVFDGVPAGDASVEVWHPRLRPGRADGAAPVRVGAATAEVELRVRLAPERRGRPDRERAPY